MRALTLPVFAGLAVAGGLVPGQDPKPNGPPDVPVLVRQLGDPDYSAREAATAALAKTPAAFGPLGEAATDRDPEVAKRAGQALKALRKRLGPDRLGRLPGYAKARQVDRLSTSPGMRSMFHAPHLPHGFATSRT
ncbi:MAG: hypothetical protein K2X82_18035, partial [Gemmataceae bacterium]|nr:hypothetical protein [Gemmataceae bacterium]